MVVLQKISEEKKGNQNQRLARPPKGTNSKETGNKNPLKQLKPSVGPKKRTIKEECSNEWTTTSVPTTIKKISMKEPNDKSQRIKRRDNLGQTGQRIKKYGQPKLKFF